ncbi:MAG: polysaccharide deacetylase family protein [Deltaproteobacteria bacterium]|nr:polysaccharide deacetylase family protein [Deltaproteobacteria bacterium]
MKVRIKIIAIVLFSALGLFVILNFSPWLALAAALIGIFYLEMIYPKLNFFSPAILNVKDQGERAVAITFDDGPSEWTLKILDHLRDQNVKSTFFFLGKNLERYPEIAKRAHAEGHTIGIHGYSHTKFHFKGADFIHEDLDRCFKSFQSLGIKPAALIRFPHGFKNFFAVRDARRRGLTICSWGKGVWDSKRPGVQTIVDRSLKLKAGEILLLHDGDGAKENPDRSQTVEALPEIIRGLKAKGFEFVTLDERHSRWKKAVKAVGVSSKEILEECKPFNPIKK